MLRDLKVIFEELMIICEENLKSAIIQLELTSTLTRLFNTTSINKNQPHFIY